MPAIRRQSNKVVENVDRVTQRRFPVEIGAPGHLITVEWPPATGAAKAEVTEASLTLTPATVLETHTDVPSSKNGNGWVITIPTGKRLSALTLRGFKKIGEDELVSSPSSGRIAVAFPPVQGGGFDSPRFSVPHVDSKGSVPASLTGATYLNRVLSLNPGIDATKVRISLVEGDNPLEFSEDDSDLDTVDATTDTPAHNAKVTAPDGTAIWQTPLFDPAGPPAVIDFRAPLEAALNRQLSAKQPASVTFALSADTPAQAFVSLAAPTGALVRIETGVIRTTVEGDPVALTLSGPLADEQPGSVTGDFSIRYSGVRILETVSDPLPPSDQTLSGVIITPDRGAARSLPPQAFDNWQPARVGVYGRAPEDCELSIEFVRMVGNAPAEALAPPAVVTLKAGGAFSTVWAQVPKEAKISGPSGIQVRANRGRFFWVTADNGRGLARIAVYDDDLGGRTLLLGGVQVAAVTQPSSHQPAFAFPPQAFQSTASVFSSDLFLVIDCADLTLRYPR
jgi:hypothetical protein